MRGYRLGSIDSVMALHTLAVREKYGMIMAWLCSRFHSPPLCSIHRVPKRNRRGQEVSGLRPVQYSNVNRHRPNEPI